MVWVAVGLTVGALLGGGITLAAIPGDDGVITACYVKSGKRAGQLRVIDAEAGATCRAGERQLTWNQQGVGSVFAQPRMIGGPLVLPPRSDGQLVWVRLPLDEDRIWTQTEGEINEFFDEFTWTSPDICTGEQSGSLRARSSLDGGATFSNSFHGFSAGEPGTGWRVLPYPGWRLGPAGNTERSLVVELASPCNGAGEEFTITSFSADIASRR